MAQVLLAQGTSSYVVAFSGPTDVSGFTISDAVDISTTKVLKIAEADEHGINQLRRPHNVFKEVRILNSLHHPNVVQLLDHEYSREDRRWYLSLPLLAITLGDLMSSPRSAKPLAVLFKSVTFQLLHGVEFIHHAGIAHRDINPSNVMLGWDGRVVLIDFGTAWDGASVPDDPDEAEGYMSCAVGTGPYRAPELLFGPQRYDAQAIDLWAIGVMLAEFFTGNGNIDPHSYLEVDPLEQLWDNLPRRTNVALFDDSFGDIGLAASIFRLRGSPNDETWPDFRSLPDSGKVEFEHFPKQDLGDHLPALRTIEDDTTKRDALEGLEHCLTLSPGHRMTAGQAKSAPWLDGPILVPPAIKDAVGPDTGYELVDVHEGETIISLLDADLVRAKSSVLSRLRNSGRRSLDPLYQE